MQRVFDPVHGGDDRLPRNAGIEDHAGAKGFGFRRGEEDEIDAAAAQQANGQDQARHGDGDRQVAVGVGQVDGPAEGHVAEPVEAGIEAAADQRAAVAG